MYLKLRTGIGSNIGWKIIDDIKQIDYKRMDEPKTFEEGAIYINNFPNIKNKKIIQIVYQLRYSLANVIYTDDVAYILNEQARLCDTMMQFFENGINEREKYKQFPISI